MLRDSNENVQQQKLNVIEWSSFIRLLFIKITFHPYPIQSLNHIKTATIPGAIFEQGTDEVQSAFKFAVLNHNLNISARKFELQAYVDVINTADAFKLSRLSEYSNADPLKYFC